jgi:hypothetical protein
MFSRLSNYFWKNLSPGAEWPARPNCGLDARPEGKMNSRIRLHFSFIFLSLLGVV